MAGGLSTVTSVVRRRGCKASGTPHLAAPGALPLRTCRERVTRNGLIPRETQGTRRKQSELRVRRQFHDSKRGHHPTSLVSSLSGTDVWSDAGYLSCCVRIRRALVSHCSLIHPRLAAFVRLGRRPRTASTAIRPISERTIPMMKSIASFQPASSRSASPF
jgi:hypothetical protein